MKACSSPARSAATSSASDPTPPSTVWLTLTAAGRCPGGREESRRPRPSWARAAAGAASLAGLAGVDTGRIRRALPDLVEVVEAALGRALRAEPETDRLQGLYGIHDVREVVAHEGPVVAELAERLAGESPVHGFDAHQLTGVARLGALACVTESGGADQIGVDEDLVARLERGQQPLAAGK